MHTLLQTLTGKLPADSAVVGIFGLGYGCLPPALRFAEEDARGWLAPSER